ncbi:hypothetical protein GCM10022393_31660 [Aquimarina addita]|uniref:Abi family protein n=1 Tax=Aquimarina addita TaxID=870485 RepID=A0ABP6UPB7_9FLAO
MGNIATSFKQQIEKLKSRGMELDYPDDKIKEILLDIGYYRLGFYWHPFEIDEDHNFKEGTRFSDVVKLYYLDVDLRNLLLKYIKRIEINFRTKLVYYVSNKYKESPTWFIDYNVVNSTFISDIDKHYNDEFKSKNKPIKLHHAKYINDKYAPAWKTLEFFTFGAILKIFKSLNENDIKERISGLYNVLNLKKFINIMDTIVYIRNTCAHSGVIFDLNTPKGISIIPGITFNENNRSSLDSTIKVILYILDKISNGRKNDLERQIDDLFMEQKGNDIIKGIIIEKIGYKYK